jgi:hypothetical protein
MARIVKLGELLPEDIAFEMPGGRTYLAPGDVQLSVILKIAELFERTSNANEDAEDAEAAGLEVMEELDSAVLGLFQIRDPELKASPFGPIGIQLVVKELLEQYGFSAQEVADGNAADPPGPAGSRPKSARSRGSRSSSTSSTSRRRTGTKSG